ncbi:methyl-accepting chemotaxis protein [Sphingomonas sp.]|uniref:methyl-accepting chemotaxis protein n=1 Tax=Sphingomonas sp. TaxID=28214 RepID=UPI002EDB74E0
MQGKMKWQDRIGLSAMIAIMVAVLLFTLSAATFVSTRSLLEANTAKHGQEMQETNIRVAWHVLRAAGTDFRVDGDRMYAGNMLLNGNEAMVDKIKALVGGAATIFRGDMRVATNVTTESGARAVGTPLKAGEAYDTVLGKGMPFRGNADILGKPYFTAYDPIKNSAGKVVGVLFVGIPASDMFAQNAAIERRMLIVTAIMTVLGVLASIFAVRLICRPLVSMRNCMAEIAGNRFEAEIPGLQRRDEIGAMAKAVLVFRENGVAKQAADAAKAKADADQQMVVSTVATHLSELAEGNLTTQIEADFTGEYASLKTNFNEALCKLRELIASVRESAASIRTGSGEIAQASEDLARRTESNAASLEETAASVTQMDGRLKASAVAATRTVERADQAIATVGGGRAVVDEAVQAMGRVSESAKGIDTVIEGLDKIAFQTRVLAMNAAVEAGRAGEAGRGFAVVADLVSALAMRAEEEAKRARDQLTVTQSEVVIAVQSVQKVDTALADISGDVGQVHELLATMATDYQAQASAITEISIAIGTMDQSTQQNAAMVEETSAAARNLSSEVDALADQAGRFTVDQGGHGNARPKRAATLRASRPASRGGSRQFAAGDVNSYNAPIKPLPAAAVSALSRPDDDWNSF